MSCIYTSGQTGPLQPKRHNVSISKQTSSGLAACSPGLEDVLIKLCDSQDSETVQKHNRGELSRKDSSTHNSPTRQKVGVWTSVGVTYFFTSLLPLHAPARAHKYLIAHTMETQAPCVDFPVKSMMLLVDSTFLTIAMETSDHLDSIFVLPLHRMV